ncbi:MAG: hypothetical protein ACYDEZ_04165, partial [Methanoregula sp.]
MVILLRIFGLCHFLHFFLESLRVAQSWFSSVSGTVTDFFCAGVNTNTVPPTMFHRDLSGLLLPLWTIPIPVARFV